MERCFEAFPKRKFGDGSMVRRFGRILGRKGLPRIVVGWRDWEREERRRRDFHPFPSPVAAGGVFVLRAFLVLCLALLGHERYPIAGVAVAVVGRN